MALPQRSIIAALEAGRITPGDLWAWDERGLEWYFTGTHPEQLVPLGCSGGFIATTDNKFAECHLDTPVVYFDGHERENSSIWWYATKTRLIPFENVFRIEQGAALGGSENVRDACASAVENLNESHAATVQFVLKCQAFAPPIHRKKGGGEFAFRPEDVRIASLRCHIGREVEGWYGGDRIAHYAVTDNLEILDSIPNNVEAAICLPHFRYDVHNGMLLNLEVPQRSLIFSDDPRAYPIEY